MSTYPHGELDGLIKRGPLHANLHGDPSHDATLCKLLSPLIRTNNVSSPRQGFAKQHGLVVEIARSQVLAVHTSAESMQTSSDFSSSLVRWHPCRCLHARSVYAKRTRFPRGAFCDCRSKGAASQNLFRNRQQNLVASSSVGRWRGMTRHDS